MADIKKIFSFLYPVTKKIPTKFNGLVEVTFINGKKVLDSKNTNYSYGSLQRVLEFALSKAYHPGINSVLLLGLGGGSMVKSLRERYGYKGKITAVEIDPVIINVAKEEFGVGQDSTLTIINEDAVPFVIQGTGAYDLIVVDVFIDDVIPSAVLEENFWQGVVRHSSRNATIIFNSLSQHPHSTTVSGFLREEGCTVQVFENVEGMNKIIIAKAC